MKVSILTPTRNNAATIRQTLESVLTQDYKNIEYIVIDGDSEDGSKDIIEAYAHKVTKVISKKSDTPCEAMNYSLRQASGDIIGSVFGDDYLSGSNIISKIVECFNDPSIQCVYGDMIYVDREDPSKILRYWKSSDYKDGSFKWGWHPTWVATFFRKEVFDRYGFLDTNLKIACDYEFLLRTIHKHKIKTKYLPEVFVYMRAGGSSSKKFINLLEANIESCLSWNANDLKTPKLFFLLKPISKFYQYFIRPK